MTGGERRSPKLSGAPGGGWDASEQLADCRKTTRVRRALPTTNGGYPRRMTANKRVSFLFISGYRRRNGYVYGIHDH